MFAETNTKIAPWTVIKANVKSDARLAAINHILKTIPYEINTK